ncbi:MAG: cysteine desulfurase [Clostridia bacterium]|nr:cysteine desulfurase [Clostridia bacterium]
MTAYFDNAATTPLCAAAKAAADDAAAVYANPSSLHAAGLAAEKLLASSRKTLLSIISAPPADTLVFTGCGTESNALLLFGAAYAKPSNRGKRIIISDSEHPSVYAAAEELGRRGFEIKTVGTRGGTVDPVELCRLVDANTLLVSIMTVNNESGAIYDIKTLCGAVKRVNPRALFHTDATQAFMKTKIDVRELGVDAMTLSAHKIGGPKGVGALYLSAQTVRSHAISPVLYGGGQEGGLRSGTENTAGAAAFAAAASYGASVFAADTERITSLRRRIVSGLTDAGVRVNEPKSYVPHIISATLPGIKSEVMLHHLSSTGVYVSSGSACSSHHPGVSRPMLAYGLGQREADCTIRISLFRDNTEEEADLLISGVRDGVKNLIKMYKRGVN